MTWISRTPRALVSGLFFAFCLLFHSTTFACEDELEVVWDDVVKNYDELPFAGLVASWVATAGGELGDYVTCVDDGESLHQALEEPECGSIVVLDDGVYDPFLGERSCPDCDDDEGWLDFRNDKGWAGFAPWDGVRRKGINFARAGWDEGSCGDDEPLVVVARNPVIAAPEATERGPGDLLANPSRLFDGSTATTPGGVGWEFDGAVLRAPFVLLAGAGEQYANIQVMGIQFYGDPRSVDAPGQAGFWMSSDDPTACEGCLIYRNLFRHIYDGRGAISLYNATGSRVIGNRFVEVGMPEAYDVDAGSTDEGLPWRGVYPLALFDSPELEIAWNLFDTLPMETTGGAIDGDTDLWQALLDGEVDWRLLDLSPTGASQNVLYGTFSGITPERERVGVCGLQFYRNVVANSAGMDIKNATCGRYEELQQGFVYDNTFFNSRGITLHGSDSWFRVDHNDFLGTEGVRITNSKTGIPSRANVQGYLHDLYVTDNLFACGGRGVLLKGGNEYHGHGTEPDAARDFYNMVVEGNWILYNDYEPFQVGDPPGDEGYHAGVWVRGLVGDGMLEVDDFGDPLPEHELLDRSLWLCGNVVAANGGDEGPAEADDAEHFSECSGIDDDERYQFAVRNDAEWINGWTDSSTTPGIYDLNTVVTETSGSLDRSAPLALAGTDRNEAFVATLADTFPTGDWTTDYDLAWGAFCKVSADALYPGAWANDYQRIGPAAPLDHQVVGDELVGRGSTWPGLPPTPWAGGATLAHIADGEGGCPTPTPAGFLLDIERLWTERTKCPRPTEGLVPNWDWVESPLEDLVADPPVTF